MATSPLALCEYVAQIDDRVDTSDLGWVTVGDPEDGSGPVLVVGSTLEGAQATEADIVREQRRIAIALVPVLQRALALRTDLARVFVLETGGRPPGSRRDRGRRHPHPRRGRAARRHRGPGAVPAPPAHRLDQNGSLKEEPPCTGLGGEATPPTTAPPPPQVVYEVLGGPTPVSLTFVTADGVSQEQDVATPLTRSFELAGFDGFYSISAQITDAGFTGSISCRITVDGQVVSEVSATGFPSIASCQSP